MQNARGINSNFKPRQRKELSDIQAFVFQIVFYVNYDMNVQYIYCLKLHPYSVPSIIAEEKWK